VYAVQNVHIVHHLPVLIIDAGLNYSTVTSAVVSKSATADPKYSVNNKMSGNFLSGNLRPKCTI